MRKKDSVNAKKVEITYYVIMRIFNALQTNHELIDGTPKHTCTSGLQ